MRNTLFTSEAVSEGHPDKVADQISDAILDEFLRQDPESKVACETFVTTGLTVVGGEVRTRGYVDVQEVARRVINRIGYNKAEYKFDGDSCGVLSALHEQSPDINQGVVRSNPDDQGAGDQGMVFGYATNETDELMPLPLVLSQITLQELAAVRREGLTMTYLRPDAKSQFTVEYSPDRQPVRVHTIVVSTQHDDFDTEKKMQSIIRNDVRDILLPRVLKRLPVRLHSLFDNDYILHVNPTGKFVVGGPHGDTGLTGRKIIVDTYGGRGAHGGGAFSGKDASKVDRSAAYAARHIAKNLVAAGVADEVLVQVAYAIGIARPVSIFVDTCGSSKVAYSDAELGEKVAQLFDLRPAKIIERFGLKYPIFERTAAYGHFGRDYVKEPVTLYYNNGKTTREVEFFAWEKLDFVPAIKQAFGMD
ncbi:MAG: methionine adenosyltransferase [Prevotellaceae bacterium]|jgi:S-adenosylmethionine synthetase|nr:methionine adenosyltransferase [Prevotellaceae bacterium]